jgi:uncharacterized delta-60 repeat protein
VTPIQTSRLSPFSFFRSQEPSGDRRFTPCRRRASRKPQTASRGHFEKLESRTVLSALTLVPSSLPPDTVNIAYNQTITASGGVAPVTLKVSNPAVTNLDDPSSTSLGLTMSGSGTSSLLISGTPTAAGTETFTVTATDKKGATASTNYTIAVVRAGIVLSPVWSNTSANGSFLDPKDNLVVAGGSIVSRYTSSGKVDTSFNYTGFTSLPSDMGAAMTAAYYPGDKIVVGGSEYYFRNRSGNVAFGLARYNADGSLDATFGSRGEVATQIGLGMFGQGVSSVLVLPGGDIVAAGNASVVIGNGQYQYFALACYTPAGALDTNFKPGPNDPIGFTTPNGTVTTTFGGRYARASSLALQCVSGKDYILAAGTNGSSCVLARYNSLNGNLDTTFGNLDTTFGNGGLVTVQPPTGFSFGAFRPSLAVDPFSGDIFVGGEWANGVSAGPAIAKFHPNGSVFDYQNADSNIAIINDVNGVAQHLAIQAIQTGDTIVDRIIVAAGNALIGVNPNTGALDPDFGAGRYAVVNSAPLSLNLVSANIRSSDGTIVAAGYAGTVAVVQFFPNGVFDTTFGQPDPPPPPPSGSFSSISNAAMAATAQPLSASTSPVAAATQGSPDGTTGADPLPLPTVGPQTVEVTNGQKIAARRGVVLRGLAAWNVDRVLADLSALDLKTALLAEEVVF